MKKLIEEKPTAVKRINGRKIAHTHILERVTVTSDDIIISHEPESEVTEYHKIYLDQVVGTEIGPMIASYLNVPIKANYEMLKTQKSLKSKMPAYYYSCPAIDDMLLGHHPRTYYFDISRGGPVPLVRRSMGYLRLAQQKHKSHTDPKMRAWAREFGVGTCIPIITFDSIVTYATQNNASLFAVPATSVAESLTACAVYFSGMRKDLQRLTKNDGWMSFNGQARNRGSLRLYEALKRYIVQYYGQKYFNELIKTGASLKVIAKHYMQMAQKLFFLGTTRSQMSLVFAETMFDPKSRRSHPFYGSQADSSELVIVGHKSLGAIPWEIVFLCGDDLGTTTKQLTDMAKAIKASSPKTKVIVLLDAQGEPLQPNYEESVTPTMCDYMITAWIDYLLEAEIHLQKSQLLLNQFGVR